MESIPIIDNVNRLIYEYLELNGLEKTMSALSTECASKSLPCPQLDKMSKVTFSQYDAQKLLISFDEGDLDGFLKIWKFFLTKIQMSNNDMKKLEVYLRVHFALWPKAHGEPEEIQTETMGALKIYFEEELNTLSNDAAILPLFALPMVSDPMSHPIFCDLFAPGWVQCLKAQLNKTLSKYFEILQGNIGIHSKLAAIVLNSQVQVGENDSSINQNNNNSKGFEQDRFFQLITTYRKVRKLLRGTRESYGKLLKVSNELILGLEKSLADKGAESVTTMDKIMEKCFIAFPELFTPNILANGKPDKEYFKKLASGAIFDSILDSDVNLFFIGISDMSPECLDYDKIKSVMISGENCISDKLCLLQALRWLLTKSTPKCRRCAMESFMSNDILGLNSESSVYRDKVFSCMLSSKPNYVKECFARFLNAIASMKTGRICLSTSNYCMEILVKSLHTFKGENEAFICQMVVATLQKMSLRKQMRLGMIEQKVIQWLVIHIKSELVKSGVSSENKNITSTNKYKPINNYNPYLMEYGWALLMNLCLHEESKGPAGAIAPDILTCVVQMLMTKPNGDVAPYIISTLYSLLRSPDIFAMAKRMRLYQTLATIIKNDVSDLASHLNHVVEILSSQGYDHVTTSGEVDYDDDDSNDPDEFEPEIEVEDTWMMSLDENISTGDDLLARNYLIFKNDVVIPKKPRTQFVEKKGVYLRPTTPSGGKNSSTNSEGNINEIRPKSKKPNTSRRQSKTITTITNVDVPKTTNSYTKMNSNVLNFNFNGQKNDILESTPISLEGMKLNSIGLTSGKNLKVLPIRPKSPTSKGTSGNMVESIKKKRRSKVQSEHTTTGETKSTSFVNTGIYKDFDIAAYYDSSSVNNGETFGKNNNNENEKLESYRVSGEKPTMDQ